MKKAYIIHGSYEEDSEEYLSHQPPAASRAHWLPWLENSLLEKGYQAKSLEMPNAHQPDYDEWKAVLSKLSMDDQTSLIGHSAGAGFLLRYLSEKPIEIDHLILVSPWLDLEKICGSFLDFELDADLFKRVNALDVFCSEDDPFDEVKDAVDEIIALYPLLTYHHFKDRGHFDAESHTTAIPELLPLLSGLK